jgi:hypothetical protein
LLRAALCSQASAATMHSNPSLIILAIAWLSCLVHAEVTILSGVQTIYDRSPKLRIKATGFTGDEHDIELVMV